MRAEDCLRCAAGATDMSGHGHEGDPHWSREGDLIARVLVWVVAVLLVALAVAILVSCQAVA